MRFAQRRREPPSRKVHRRTAMIRRNALILSALCISLAAFFALRTNAQDSRSGQWIIDTTTGTNQYHLTLSYTSESGRGNSMNSFNFSPDRLGRIAEREMIL